MRYRSSVRILAAPLIVWAWKMSTPSPSGCDRDLMACAEPLSGDGLAGRGTAGEGAGCPALSQDDQRGTLRDRSGKDRGGEEVRRHLRATNTDLNPLEAMLC